MNHIVRAGERLHSDNINFETLCSFTFFLLYALYSMVASL